MKFLNILILAVIGALFSNVALAQTATAQEKKAVSVTTQLSKTRSDADRATVQVSSGRTRLAAGVTVGPGLVLTVESVLRANIETLKIVGLDATSCPATVIASDNRSGLVLLQTNCDLPVQVAVSPVLPEDIGEISVIGFSVMNRRALRVGNASRRNNPLTLLPEGQAEPSPNIIALTAENRLNLALARIGVAGMSGSGVFSETDGSLLGLINERTVIIERDGKRTNAVSGLVVPAPVIHAFLKQSGHQPPTSPNKTSQR